MEKGENFRHSLPTEGISASFSGTPSGEVPPRPPIVSPNVASQREIGKETRPKVHSPRPPMFDGAPQLQHQGTDSGHADNGMPASKTPTDEGSVTNTSGVNKLLPDEPHDEPTPPATPQWKPTEEFFLSDPRSAEIRDVCMEIIKRVDILRTDPDVGADYDHTQTMYAELENLGGRLIELDVTPGMNKDLPQQQYQSDPVIMAEYVAGQLYPMTGHSIISETDIEPVIQELNVGEDKEVVIETELMPKKMENFVTQATKISSSKTFLAIAEDHED